MTALRPKSVSDVTLRAVITLPSKLYRGAITNPFNHASVAAGHASVAAGEADQIERRTVFAKAWVVAAPRLLLLRAGLTTLQQYASPNGVVGLTSAADQ